jgi:FkbM family methyltransferase
MNLSSLISAAGDRVGRHNSVVRALSPFYSEALQLAYGRRGLPWSINGEPIRIDPRLRHMLPKENEATLFRFLSDSIRPGDVVFDIGAFLGTYAMLAARRSGASGRVFAFEPSPDSFAGLKRHLEMNGLDEPRVTARRAAVGAHEGRRVLTTFDHEPYRNMIAPSSFSNGTTVEVVTVDGTAAAIGRPPDWIRMDVQGLEFEVLQGATNVLALGRTKIVAEMHPDQWPDYGVQRSEATERFAALGLRARPLVAGGPTFEQSGHVLLEFLEP